MDPEDSAPVRRLLEHSPDTAGGLMTPRTRRTHCIDDGGRGARPGAQPRPDARAGLARVRGASTDRHPPPARISAAFICSNCCENPPASLVGGVVDSALPRLSPDDSLTAVTRYFATYNLVCGPVVDDEDHLVGAVTVDDVLDHLLPEDWRDQEVAGQ